MPYVEGRVVHDADSHVVETPEWFEPWADPVVRARMDRVYVSVVKPGEDKYIERIRQRRLDPDDRAARRGRDHAAQELERHGIVRQGGPPARPRFAGLPSQLVFNTFFNKYLVDVEHRRDAALTYGVARAHNRAMVDFCSVDRRLLPVGYVPLADFERAARHRRRGDRAGGARR